MYWYFEKIQATINVKLRSLGYKTPKKRVEKENDPVQVISKQRNVQMTDLLECLVTDLVLKQIYNAFKLSFIFLCVKTFKSNNF